MKVVPHSIPISGSGSQQERNVKFGAAITIRQSRGTFPDTENQRRFSSIKLEEHSDRCLSAALVDSHYNVIH